MLLNSSSILSSCQDHVQFLPFTVGVLPKLYQSYSLFLFSTAVLSIVFNSVMFFLSTFQPLEVHGFTRSSKKQLSFTSSLPLPFLSGAILDHGTRSSRSGGVL